MTVKKPKPKQLLQPITTGTGSAMNQSQFLAITCNSLEARERSRVHGAIGFGFDSHCLKNWRESFKPITRRSNRSQVFTFDSYLKTALSCEVGKRIYLGWKYDWIAKPGSFQFFNSNFQKHVALDSCTHRVPIFSALVYWNELLLLSFVFLCDSDTLLNF